MCKGVMWIINKVMYIDVVEYSGDRIISVMVICLIFQIPASILDKDNYYNFLLNRLTPGLTAEYSHTNILLTRSDN